MPKIILHRGARKYAPENTIPAFLKAYEFDPDGIEFDVQVTRDKNLVICHNNTIDETSDGKGLISEYGLKELRAFDFGAYFGEAFKGTKIPTLDEALNAAQKFKVINIEIKSPKNDVFFVVQKTIDQVIAFGLKEKVLISSFDERVVKQVKEINQSIKTGFIYSPREMKNERLMEDYIGYAKELGVDALHPHFLLVSKKYVKQAHENGFAVNVWTVNRHSRMKRLKNMNCDGIVTDAPELANKALKD